MNATSDIALPKLYDEILTLFKTSVTFLTFFAGVMGVSFAIQFLQKYYKPHLTPDIMVWYGVMVIYLCMSIVMLWVRTLYDKMVQVRREMSARVNSEGN